MNKFRKPHGKDRDEKRFGRQNDRPSFGPRPSYQDGGNRGFGKSEKFEAICSHCGKSCQVPFRPNGKKPVFCSECFNKERSASPVSTRQPEYASPSPSYAQAPRRENEDGRIDALKRQVDALNIKIDRILEAVTKAPQTVAPKAEVAPVEIEIKKKRKPELKKKIVKKKSKRA